MIFCRYRAGESASSDLSVVSVGKYLSDTLRVPAIVGPSGSEHVSDLFEAIKRERRTLLITPSATSELLRSVDPKSEGRTGLLWRTVPTDSLQADRMAELVTEQGMVRLALLFQDDSYGQSLANDIRDQLKGRVELLESVFFPLRADEGESRARVKDSVAEAFQAPSASFHLSSRARHG